MMRTFTPISSILISILLVIFFVQPEYEKVTMLQQEIDAYNKAAAQYDSFTALLEEKLKMKENRSAYESERLNALVPENVDTTQLLVDLEGMVKNQNMLFGNIAVNEGDTQGATQSRDSEGAGEVESPSQEELRTVDISFGVIGTYEQFKKFLVDLEQSVTLFEVIEITFVANDDMFQQYALTVRVHALQN